MNDKNILNIAGIIAIVGGILCCVTIVGAVAGVPAIIGGNTLRKYSQMSDQELAANKENLLIWSIVLCIICTLSGVLGLVFYFSFDNTFNINGIVQSSDSKKFDELDKLNKLYQSKAITKEEFEKEKARILNK